jgi:hypothetical protein
MIRAISRDCIKHVVERIGYAYGGPHVLMCALVNMARFISPLSIHVRFRLGAV